MQLTRKDILLGKVFENIFSGGEMGLKKGVLRALKG